MKNKIKVLIVTLILLCVVGCNKQTQIVQDDSPITMFVGLGNGMNYYNELKQLIYDELGIEVEFIYESTFDTTSYIREQFANNDLCADIMVTASKTNDSLLEESCLDLLSYTHISDYFTYEKVTNYTTENGQLFQLPFTSRLIGITYNKTLMDELGFEVPNNYQELLDIKNKCDQLGVKFAVSGGVATGHGFNYLFHIMGSEWLSTLEGREWFDSYLKTEADIEPLKQHSSYFKELVENGIFGSFHDFDWSASYEFSTTRALFLFDITNSIYSYDGPLYDEQGQPTDIILHDEYASMPWLSKNGENNCFTYYDNFFLYVNKKLAADNQKDRLNKIIQILEFMTTYKVTSLFSKNFKDGYTAVKDYNIDESKLYYKYSQNIVNGYIQPWYYNYFDNDTIVNTGAAINAYIKDGSKSFDEIFETFDTNYKKYFNQTYQPLTTFQETLTYKDTAKLSIIAGMNSIYKNSGLMPDVGMMLYIEKENDLLAFSKVCVQNSKAYKGEFLETSIKTLICKNGVIAVYMLGSEIKELINNGYTEEDKHYQFVTVGVSELTDEQLYLVSLPITDLQEDLYNTLLNDNRILLMEGKVLEAPIEEELINYLKNHNNITSSSIVLD